MGRVLTGSNRRGTPYEPEGSKQGFYVPTRRWLSRDLAAQVEQLVLAEGAQIASYLGSGYVRGLWQRLQGKPNARLDAQSWRILNFAVWHEIHWARSDSPRDGLHQPSQELLPL
ncbi:MAG: hypothetical protein GY769_19845 [bacterium]|nr:hypothetical protein [bacterium]